MGNKKKNINKLLNGIDNPYRVPDGYFDNFSQRLMSKIEQQEGQASTNVEKERPLGIIKYLKPALAMAASFAIIFFLIYIPVTTIAPKMTDNQNQEEIMELDYFDYYYTSSNSLIEIFENNNQNNEYIHDELVEAYLLASMSEYDFLNLIE